MTRGPHGRSLSESLSVPAGLDSCYATPVHRTARIQNTPCDPPHAYTECPPDRSHPPGHLALWPAPPVPQTGGVGGVWWASPVMWYRAPRLIPLRRARPRGFVSGGCTPAPPHATLGGYVGTPPPRGKVAPYSALQNSTASGPSRALRIGRTLAPPEGVQCRPDGCTARARGRDTRTGGDNPAPEHTPRDATGDRPRIRPEHSVRHRVRCRVRSETLAGSRGSLGTAGPVLPSAPRGRMTVQGSHFGGPAIR